MTALGAQVPALVVTSGSRRAAIPIAHVRETMRPLPVEPVAGAPAWVRGLAVIRGAPVPVVDLDALLGGGAPGDHHRRFVTVTAGARVVALAVDDVLGVERLDPAAVGALPPLVDAGDEAVAAVGALDAQLVVVLRAAQLVPDEAWAALDAERTR